MATEREWDSAPTFGGQEVIDARNANEAHLYVDVAKGTIVDTRANGPRFEILADTDTGRYRFSFSLEKGVEVMHDFGEGLSRILDPVDLLMFAERVERELPATIQRNRATARRLRRAAAALLQAARFAGLGDPPADVFKNAISRRFAEQQPERLRALSLIKGSQRLNALAEMWDDPL